VSVIEVSAGERVSVCACTKVVDVTLNAICYARILDLYAVWPLLLERFSHCTRGGLKACVYATMQK
jgi:hypothetical protein